MDSKKDKDKEYGTLYNELGYLFFEISKYDDCITFMEKALYYSEKEMEEEKD